MLAFFEAAFLFMEEPPSGYKLSLFEDLSRFVGDDSIKHTAKLDLGEGDVILCSGLILANTSQHLEDAVKSSDTLSLVGFTREGVLDCLRLLHGGSITLNLHNFTDLLKFGVFFQVPQFPELCLSWVKVEKDVASLLKAATVILGNSELAEYCGGSYWDEEGGRSGTKLLSICWRDMFDHNDLLRECRKTLVQSNNQQDTMEHLLAEAGSLPDNMILFLFGLDTISSLYNVLQVWINSSKRVNIMLKCISTLLETQQKDVVLHSEALSNLLDLMDSLAELPRETTQQIRKLESGLMKRVMNQMIKAVDINNPVISIQETLNNKVWRSFDRRQFAELKKSLNLPEYLFIELFLDWTEHAEPKKSDIMEIWKELDLPNTSPIQVKYLRQFIMSKFNIPLIAPLVENNHTTVCYKCNTNLVQQLRNGKYASFTFPMTSKPGLNPAFKLRLSVERDPHTGVSYETDKTTGDDLEISHKVVHWFIVGLESFSLWNMFERTTKGPVFMSLLVNDYEAMCSVLQACSRRLEVYALLEET